MEKLLAYIKPLSRAQRAEFFARCGTTEGYVRKVASMQGRLLGPAICVSLERETGGALTRRDLRPDDCEAIWPDLTVSA